MSRTTARLLAASLLLAAASARASQAPPPPRGRVAEYESSQRLFWREDNYDRLAELTERWQYSEQRNYRALTLGSYAHPDKHLKLGAFYRLQYGARHDNDWAPSGPGQWGWRVTTQRPESVVTLDATPQIALGGDLVASAKVRLERNFFSAENVLKLEPELAWFWLDGLTPRATLFLRYETDFPLNFGQTTVWQRWYYLAGLWHATPSVSLGPCFALRDEVWSTSSSFKSEAPNAPGYQTLFRAWVLSLELVVHLPG